MCSPCASDATDESEDTDTEVREPEVHEREVQGSEVHECMAQAQLKA